MNRDNIICCIKNVPPHHTSLYICPILHDYIRKVSVLYLCKSYNRQRFIGGKLWVVTQIIEVQLISFIIKCHCGFQTIIILSIYHLNWCYLNNSAPQNYMICYLPCTEQKMDPFLSQGRLLSKETTLLPWYHYLQEKRFSFTARMNWHLYTKNVHFLLKIL